MKSQKTESSLLTKVQQLPRWGQAVAAATALLVLWSAFQMVFGGGLGDVVNAGAQGPVVAFGDSLTEGMGSSPGQDYPSHLSRLWGIEVINAGVSGNTTENALGRLQEDCLSQKPGLVLLAFGGNDFLQRKDLDQAGKNLRKLVLGIQEQGAAVVLIGLNIGGPFLDYPGMFERVAKETGCLYLDDWTDGIMGDPDLKSDDIHPNDKGYQLLAERVDKRARKLFEKGQP